MKIEWQHFFFLLFIVNFSILSCKSNSSGPEVQKPDAPIIVPKSAENSVIEKGVDAIPEMNAIFFEWRSPRAEVQGWNVYKKKAESGSFQFLTNVSNVDTSFIDQNVLVGTRYWYYVTAVGLNGQESQPSDTVDYKLLEKANSLSNTLDVHPVFEWHTSGVAPIFYILRLYENPQQKPIWITEISPGYQGQRETVNFNSDGSAVETSLEKNKTYSWRVDELGSEANSGSESHWKVFTVPE